MTIPTLGKYVLSNVLSDTQIASFSMGKIIRTGSVLTDKTTNEPVALIRQTMHKIDENFNRVHEKLDNVQQGVNMIQDGISATQEMVKLSNLLGMSNLAMSTVNLGATIALGSALLSKMGKLENNIKHLDDKMNQIQWTIEAGFLTTIDSIQTLMKFNDIELIGDLNAAANIAWTCQFLKPNSTQRTIRLEQAYSIIATLVERLMIITESEITILIEKLQAGSPDDKLKIEQDMISNLQRLQLTCVAISLFSSINAETGNLQATYLNLDKYNHRLF